MHDLPLLLNIAVALAYALVGGIVATYVVEELARRRASSVVPAVAFCAALGVAAVIGSMVVAA